MQGVVMLTFQSEDGAGGRCMRVLCVNELYDEPLMNSLLGQVA